MLYLRLLGAGRNAPCATHSQDGAEEGNRLHDSLASLEPETDSRLQVVSQADPSWSIRWNQPEQSCVRPALTGEGGISGEPDDTERVQSGSEGGRWKSTCWGNSLAAYPTPTFTCNGCSSQHVLDQPRYKLW